MVHRSHTHTTQRRLSRLQARARSWLSKILSWAVEDVQYAYAIVLLAGCRTASSGGGMIVVMGMRAPVVGDVVGKGAGESGRAGRPRWTARAAYKEDLTKKTTTHGEGGAQAQLPADEHWRALTSTWARSRRRLLARSLLRNAVASGYCPLASDRPRSERAGRTPIVAQKRAGFYIISLISVLATPYPFFGQKTAFLAKRELPEPARWEKAPETGRGCAGHYAWVAVPARRQARGVIVSANPPQNAGRAVHQLSPAFTTFRQHSHRPLPFSAADWAAPPSSLRASPSDPVPAPAPAASAFHRRRPARCLTPPLHGIAIASHRVLSHPRSLSCASTPTYARRAAVPPSGQLPTACTCVAPPVSRVGGNSSD
ncbi:hypothetical protein CC78DRAFT_578027 [Lojkania enalia]|uniref:Uncharacterized protein n=1 Tax=Lojkania enalia TaxID=147567 RepID=A0A9P4N586_9PLEO|nr:hypothetical protein CC78DRAFT_578027 [Didymosphaeria enalia]